MRKIDTLAQGRSDEMQAMLVASFAKLNAEYAGKSTYILFVASGLVMVSGLFVASGLAPRWAAKQPQ